VCSHCSDGGLLKSSRLHGLQDLEGIGVHRASLQQRMRARSESLPASSRRRVRPCQAGDAPPRDGLVVMPGGDSFPRPA
jgi:hypothetical protein